MNDLIVLKVLTTVLLLVVSITDGQQSTVTKTKTVKELFIKTEIKKTTKSTFCASIITTSSSAVTACRRRRQYWIDTPVFIAVNDDDDQHISQFLLRPTHVFPVEPTVVPGAAFKGDKDDSSPSFDVVSSQYVNEPSTFQTTGDYFQPRIYLAELANFFANLFRTTLIEFVTRTKTKTVTRTSTETTTNSFFLSGCTPSPFPFLICK